MKHNLKIGQPVYVVPLNRDRRNIKEPYFSEIDYIGTKWFTISKLYQTKFSTVDLLEKDSGIGYGRHYSIYLTKEEYDNKLLLTAHKNEIKSLIDGLNLSQTTQILNIITN